MVLTTETKKTHKEQLDEYSKSVLQNWSSLEFYATLANYNAYVEKALTIGEMINKLLKEKLDDLYKDYYMDLTNKKIIFDCTKTLDFNKVDTDILKVFSKLDDSETTPEAYIHENDIVIKGQELYLSEEIQTHFMKFPIDFLFLKDEDLRNAIEKFVSIKYFELYHQLLLEHKLEKSTDVIMSEMKETVFHLVELYGKDKVLAALDAFK